MKRKELVKGVDYAVQRLYARSYRPHPDRLTYVGETEARFGSGYVSSELIPADSPEAEALDRRFVDVVEVDGKWHYVRTWGYKPGKSRRAVFVWWTQHSTPKLMVTVIPFGESIECTWADYEQIVRERTRAHLEQEAARDRRREYNMGLMMAAVEILDQVEGLDFYRLFSVDRDKLAEYFDGEYEWRPDYLWKRAAPIVHAVLVTHGWDPDLVDLARRWS